MYKWSIDLPTAPTDTILTCTLRNKRDTYITIKKEDIKGTEKNFTKTRINHSLSESINFE